MITRANHFRPTAAAILLAMWCGWQLLFAYCAVAADAGGKQALDRWLRRQAAVRTWSADVKQIRSLKALSKPLETSGKVWFKQPNRFRWQLGKPPRTIAVRTADALLIVYPPLKRVERYPLSGTLKPSWRYVTALLDVGFPADPQAFYANYELKDAVRKGNVWRFDLRPAAAQARRLLEQVRLYVSARNWRLKATELAFPDGSIMRNEFHHMKVNPDLPPSLFTVSIPKDYEVVNPLSDAGRE